MNRGFSVLRSALVAVAIVGVLTLAVSSPVAASSEDPEQPYWDAEFFDARWPTSRPVYTTRYTDIDFDWGTGSPNVAVPVDNFSARWTRTVDFEAGNYRFWMIHDDGVLLWIDDQLTINQWYDQPAYLEFTHGPTVANVHSELVSLSAGPHRLKVEYYEHGKNAVVKLGWALSDSGPTEFVPSPASTLQSDQIHVVRPGEWLYKIARQYQMSASDIMKANDLASGKLVPGQQLAIPGAASAPEPVAASPGSATAPSAATTDGGCRGTYIVRSGDNLFRVSLKFGSSLNMMAAQNGISAPYTLHVGQALCLP